MRKNMLKLFALTQTRKFTGVYESMHTLECEKCIQYI